MLLLSSRTAAAGQSSNSSSSQHHHRQPLPCPSLQPAAVIRCVGRGAASPGVPGAWPTVPQFRRHRWQLLAVDGAAAPLAEQQQQQAPSSSGNGNGAARPPAGQQHAAATAAAAQASWHGGSAAAAAAGAESVATASTDDAVEGIQMGDQRNIGTGLHVRVRDMLKHFQTPKGVFRAVDGVDVDVEPSTICALLGPSGSGKTTLLRLVAGLEEPTGGHIYFDDLEATNLPVQDRQVGMVFQSYALFNHMTVAENIKFGLEVRNTPGDHNARVADLLELVQLTGLGDRYPRQLSGGQRQRVALARALASGPKLLLLDEPFGALDAVVRKTLRAGLKEIVRSVGVTTIIVTHDQEEAFDLADKVVIFNRGIIEQSGTPTEIIKRPATPFVMNFVGDTNSVPANCLLVRRSGFKNDGARARVMFRPSDIQLYTEFRDSVDGHLVTPANVSEVGNMGWTVKYVLRFDDDVEVDYAVARAQADGALKLDVGQRIYLYVKPSAMLAYDEEQLDSAPLV